MAHLAERHQTYASEFEAFRREASFGPGWLHRSRDRALPREPEIGQTRQSGRVAERVVGTDVAVEMLGNRAKERDPRGNGDRTDLEAAKKPT